LIYNKVTFLESEDRKKIAKKLKNNRKNKSLGKMVKKSNSHSNFISEHISKLPIIKRFVIFGLLPILLTTIITQSYFINRVQDLEWKAKEIEMKEIIAHYEDSITELMIRTSRISQNLAVNPNIIAAHESEFLDWFPNILKNNPEIYKELEKRLSKKWNENSKETKIDAIHHSIRNENGNTRNNTKRSIKKLLSKPSLFDNRLLIDKRKLKIAGM